VNLQQFHRWDFRHQQSPGISPAKIDLLEVLVEQSLRKQTDLFFDLTRENRELRGVFATRRLSDFRDSSTQCCPRFQFVRNWVYRVRRVVRANETSNVLGHRAERRRLAVPHMLVEVSRPPDSLTRVVDDEVQSTLGGQQLRAECFDTRRVPQIEAVDLESVPPLGEIGLASVALSGVARKARGDDEARAGAKQLDARLITDFHATAG